MLHKHRRVALSVIGASETNSTARTRLCILKTFPKIFGISQEKGRQAGLFRNNYLFTADLLIRNYRKIRFSTTVPGLTKRSM